MCVWEHNPSSFLVKACGLTAVLWPPSTQTAYLLPAHLFSLCSPADLNEGDFCPAVIFQNAEVEGETGRHVTAENRHKTEVRRWGAGGRGEVFIHALLVNSDTFDNAGSVFRA